MTRAHTIMTALLTRAIEAGEVELRGAQLYQGGRPVMPRLGFIADQKPATSTAAAGIRPPSGEQHEEKNVAYPMFAPLPPDRLVPAEKATADRARMAQQRHTVSGQTQAAQRSIWDGCYAPLPGSVLVKRDWHR
jgi:hypothetical protein